MISILKKKQSKPEGLCCISFNSEGIAITHSVEKDTEKSSTSDITTPQLTSLKHCDFLTCKNPSQRELVLGSYVKY